MTNSTVLVIGGGKFIGRHIVERLTSTGHKVTILTRGTSRNPNEGRVEWLRCDRDDGDAFSELLYRRDFDYVIDVISFTAAHAQFASDFFFGRTSRFIQISTGSIYLLDRKRINPLREEDCVREIDPDPPVKGSMLEYGYHKRAAEIVLEKAYAEKGFPAVILRPPVVSGKYDYSGRDQGYILRVKDGGPLLLPIDRHGSHRHVWIDDLIDAVILALTARDAPGKAFNIASHSILSLPDYLGMIADALEVKSEIKFLHSEILKRELGADFSPFSYRWDFIMDISRAREILGYNPTGSREWLPGLARHFSLEFQGDPPPDFEESRRKEIELAGSHGSETR